MSISILPVIGTVHVHFDGESLDRAELREAIAAALRHTLRDLTEGDDTDLSVTEFGTHTRVFVGGSEFTLHSVHVYDSEDDDSED